MTEAHGNIASYRLLYDDADKFARKVSEARRINPAGLAGRQHHRAADHDRDRDIDIGRDDVEVGRDNADGARATGQRHRTVATRCRRRHRETARRTQVGTRRLKTDIGNVRNETRYRRVEARRSLRSVEVDVAAIPDDHDGIRRPGFEPSRNSRASRSRRRPPDSRLRRVVGLRRAAQDDGARPTRTSPITCLRTVVNFVHSHSVPASPARVGDFLHDEVIMSYRRPAETLAKFDASQHSGS